MQHFDQKLQADRPSGGRRGPAPPLAPISRSHAAQSVRTESPATAYKHIVLIVLLCSAFYSSLAVLHLPELNQGSSTTTRSAGKCTIGASTVVPGSASLQSSSRLLLISSTIQPTGSKPMRCRCRQSTGCNDGIPLCCTMSLHTCAFLSQEHEQNPLS